MKRLLKILMIPTILTVPILSTVAWWNKGDVEDNDNSDQEIAKELAAYLANNPLRLVLSLDDTENKNQTDGNKLLTAKIEKLKVDFKERLSLKNQEKYNPSNFKISSEIYKEAKLNANYFIDQDFYQTTHEGQMAYFNFSYRSNDKNVEHYWGASKIIIKRKRIALSSEIITNSHLLDIYVGQKTREQIKEEPEVLEKIKMQLKNKNVNLDITEIQLSQIKEDKPDDSNGWSALVIPAGEQGVSIYKGEFLVYFNINNFNNLLGINKNFEQLIITTNGTIYAGSNDNDNKVGGLYVSNDGKNFEIIKGTENLQIYSLASDIAGNIYIGTNENLYKFEIDKDFPENPESLIKDWNGEIDCIVIDQNNNIYAGTSNGWLYHKTINQNTDENNDFEKFNISEKRIGSLTIDQSGIIFAGADDGLYKCDIASKINVKINETDSWTFNDLINDREGNIYAATNLGVYKISQDENKKITIKKIIGTQEGIIYSITIDQQGNIYAGDETRIYKYVVGQENFVAFYDKEYNKIKSLITDKNSNIYAGAKNGIFISESF